MSYKSLNSNIPAIVYYCESDYSSSSSGFTIIKVESSAANSITPMELVREALVKGISQMKQFNERMDRQYPNSVAYVG